MANEIVTVERNGEIIDLEVPMGTSADDIEAFLSSQESTTYSDATQETLSSMPSLDDTTPLTDPDEWGKSGITGITGGAVDIGADAAKDIYALLQVGTTMATGAISSITASAFGAAAMLFGRDPEQTANDVARYSEAGTILPWGERGTGLLEDMAVPLMAMEEGADDLSWWLAGGNPTAATMIKTQLLGAAELLLPFKASKTALQNSVRLSKRAKEMKQLADDLGIDMSQSGLRTSIVELAERMTPAQRAEHMPYLQEQLKLASDKVKVRKDKLYEEARASETYVNSGSVNQLSEGMRTNLAKDFDLDEMPRVQKTFDKLAAATDAPPSVVIGAETLPPTRINLRKFEDVRRKLNAQINNAKVNNPSEAAALIRIKKDMDAFLDNELQVAAIDAGKSAISGDMAGVQAYKAAREATRDWHVRFNTDKVIKNFINKEATPETMTQWLVGSSATGVAARREAGLTIQRMKAALGDDHPAIQGIRQDFLYEVASPLLHPDGPNFNQFVRNYELMVDRNPTLVEVLNLNRGDFKELHDLARLQQTLIKKGFMDDAGARDVIRRITTIVSRLAVGHGIAKAGVRVNLMRDALNIAIGLDRVSQKNMFYELAGLKYGDIMLPRGHPLAAEFIAGAALTEISDAQEQN